jgi:hypothetical protein
MVRNSLWQLLVILLMGVFTAIVAVIVVVAAWGFQVSASTAKAVTGIASSGPAHDAWVTSPEQSQTLSKWGYPESFAILFYDEQTEAGTLETTRYETWSYFTRGEELTFINGELAGEKSLPPAIVLLSPIPYKPERFAAYMSLPQVVQAGRLASFTEIPLENQLLPGGKAYFADRLTFGVKDGGLRYIETLPLVD